MSPISWPQWFPAFERSQKKITECHNLIMYFRVSLDVLLLFGNSASPFWSLSLSFPIIPRHAFIFLLLSLSAHFHFFSSFFFLISNFSFRSHPLSFLSCPAPSFFCTLVFSFILLPLFTSALIHSSSASLFYMGRWQSSWPTMAMCQRQ